MSLEEPGDVDAVRREYESLSQEASTLAMSLARRRADVALMRAEAATVAVSLESAKEELDNLLRKETVIRTQAQISPPAEHARADFFPDQGLIRSLVGQLEVTQNSVKASSTRKKSMEAEIDRLEKLLSEKGDGADGSVQQGQDAFSRGGPLQDNDLDGRSSGVLGGVVYSHGDERNIGTHMVAPHDAKKPARSSMEEGVLQTLHDGAESKSSFRFDHARIWRDVTMPNLALVHKGVDALTGAGVSLGVVIERIFEGVTCFTPTSAAENGKRSSAADMRIETGGEIRETQDSIATVIAEQFGILSVATRDDSKKARVIAPKVALDRVMDLISEGESSVLKRARPKLPVDESEQPTHSTGSGDARGAGALLPTRSPRGERPSDMNVSVKLAAASHVLHIEHFKQIMVQGVPARFLESGLELVYSTNLHGMSLHTLFNRVKKTSPTLIAIRDTKDRVFGCYAASPWKSSAARYYGTGESFVFGTSGPDVAKVYKWSRANSFFQFTSSTFLAIGGGAGSHFALWVDEDLLMGTTSACSTFASPPLTSINDENAASCIEFKIVSLEVWGFNAHIHH